MLSSLLNIWGIMAKLPDQTLTTIFYLQRRLVELIDEAKAVEFAIFERFGENETTLPELDQMLS